MTLMLDSLQRVETTGSERIFPIGRKVTFYDGEGSGRRIIASITPNFSDGEFYYRVSTHHVNWNIHGGEGLIIGEVARISRVGKEIMVTPMGRDCFYEVN